MAWQTPKISWTESDAFRLDPDYERIRGNLLYLRQRAAAITRRPDYGEMSSYTADGLPLADFFNRVEENLAALADAVQPRPEYSTRSFSPGSLVWDWRDLERIEGMLLQVCNDLNAIESGQQKLAFCLGGGLFGTFVS
ncbi:hypothetical protein [Allofournierella massiliensis]|uniref:Uncharacterized protein n=1 Tax=Allofournierella massiliensis TaxID=1650663 RepID=A0ABT7UQ01_9FIRM|nr:hypothetical protein [Fournierella massiliensis]MDM8200815.1 hypothetical protein [Fournierella massiliensis]